jgi:hypothetical protein
MRGTPTHFTIGNHMARPCAEHTLLALAEAVFWRVIIWEVAAGPETEP